MNQLPHEIEAARGRDIQVTEDTLAVDLVDGRRISVPLGWYPRLSHASMKERKRWRLIGQGQGIHWPDLDEDVSVANLLAGRVSGESQQSLQRWLEERGGRRKKPRGQ